MIMGHAIVTEQSDTGCNLVSLAILISCMRLFKDTQDSHDARAFFDPLLIKRRETLSSFFPYYTATCGDIAHQKFYTLPFSVHSKHLMHF